MTAPVLKAPPVLRRLAAFVYEGVLLFGVLMIAGYLYSSLTQQRHALQGKLGLQAFLFIVLGIYFVWFWARSGQTVATQAWRIRVVSADGGPVSQGRALARYLLSWMWFAPALVSLGLAGERPSGGIVSLVLLVGVVGYAALSWLRADRQFWHDAICGTRLISVDPPPRQNPGP